MSSFLQRLATQAMGKTNTLRTMARHPYAVQPSPVNAEVRDNQIDAFGNPADAQHDADNRGAQPGLNALPSPSPEALVTQSLPGNTNNPDRTDARSSLAKTMSALPDANLEQPVVGKSQVLAEGIEIQIPEDNSATSTIFHHKQNPTPPDSDVPTNLLPLSNSTHPLMLNTGAVVPRGMSRDSAMQAHIEETTEVHVSIGRIEVTAVHETPPPKCQAPTSAKPMSLDEYLSRRKREA